MTFTWSADFSGIEEKWAAAGSDDVKERALILATSSLQMLTNNRVGTPPIKIRPCPVENPCRHDWFGYRWDGGSRDGWWLNPCGCSSARWCAPLSEVDIPGPVGFIDEVRINGEVIDLQTGDWRLDDGHLLVWQGTGPSPIPSVQNLNLPDTEPGTWSITYSKSYPVSAMGQTAVAYLALEFAAAFKPKGRCALPRGVTSVVRSGVNFTIEAGLFPNGLTGEDTVDAFILQWTPPGSPTQNAVVFNPRSAHRNKARVTSRVPVRESSNTVLDGGTI